MTAPGHPFQPVKSADRTLEILEVLAAADQRLSLGELSRDLGIPKSSLHAILRTMVNRRWVDVDASGARFSLGVRALHVGASFVDSDDVVTSAQPVLDWLSEQIREAVHLGRLDGSDIVYLAKRESVHPLRLFSAIGRRLPAHATALGKSLLAQRSNDDVERLLSWPLPALTPRTITTRGALLAELEKIRAQGFAVDNEENAQGIRCFAVALEIQSPPHDALSASVPTIRLDPERETSIVALLTEARRRMRPLRRGDTPALPASD